MLGLERLIVGRECNGFDRLPPARKSRAFAELIHLGYAYGKVEEVAGQDFPNVSVQRVSSRGRRLRRSLRSSRGAKKGKGRGEGAARYVVPSTIPQVEARTFAPEDASVWRGVVRSEWCGH